jgi:DNA-binding CsgD family transcriptional regulator
VKSPIPGPGAVLCLARLTSNKLRSLGITPQHLRRLFHLIPLRERYALRLYHLRGASQRELAGLLGVSPRTVRRLLERARGRLRDPLNLAFMARWNRLEPAARRLVDLHRLKGLPLRDIARMGLLAVPPRRGPSAGTPAAGESAPDPRRAARPAGLRELQAYWRRLERRGRRWAGRRQAGGSDAAEGDGDASSSTG